MASDPLALSVIKLKQELAKTRSIHEGAWRECIEEFAPCAWDQSGVAIPTCEDLKDSRGRRAANIFSSGLVSMVIPKDSPYFEYSPPPNLRHNERVIKYLRECTEVVSILLSRSNFYEEVQVFMMELGIIGTACLFVGDMHEGGLFFKNQHAFSYYIAEDHRGRVDTVIRDLKLTANQASDEFGYKNLPERVAKLVDTDKGSTELHDFIHCVMPNRIKDKRGVAAKKARPWRDLIVYEKDKHVVRDDGYHSFPFCVCRYIKVGDSPWGFGPGSIAKGDSRAAQGLTEDVQVASEKANWTPIVGPAKYAGLVDMSPGGYTGYDEGNINGADAFKALGANTVRPEMPMQMLEMKHEAIDAAFFVELFKLFTSKARGNREMTATEAQFMSREALSQFAPVGSRVETEFLIPCFARVFQICWRAPGVLFQQADPPPDEILGRDSEGKPNGKYETPDVSLKNKISLQLGLKQNMSWNEASQGLVAMAQIKPDVVDNFDLDKISKDYARNAGVPEGWVMPPEKLKKIRSDRAEEQAQAAQMQQIEQASVAAKNIGQAGPAVAGALGAQ